VPCKCGMRFGVLWREDVRKESRDDIREPHCDLCQYRGTLCPLWARWHGIRIHKQPFLLQLFFRLFERSRMRLFRSTQKYAV
jgi:hypothetical protein